MSAFLTKLKSFFASPADRSGLTAIIVSLATSIGSAMALTGAARTSAFITAGVVALFGFLQIIRPDNAAIKSPTLATDSEQAIRDALTAFAAKSPSAFAAIVQDAAKIATDLTAKSIVTVAILGALLLPSLGLAPAKAYDVSNINTPARTATYSATIVGLTPASAATDFLVIEGSATEVVRVKAVACTGVSTAAGSAIIKGDVMSTADTGGTSTAPTILQHDSNDIAPTATVLAYTANPTLGTLNGVARIGILGTAITGGGSAVSMEPILWSFGWQNDKEIVLRGTAQEFSLNANAVSFPAGTALSCYIEWTESGS
jgi:hypothetical protein